MNDRLAWLKEVRRVAEERYDTLWAPIYDENWGVRIDPTHSRCLARFLGLLPPHSRVLDAACGTGKVWAVVLAGGHSLSGMDQSQGMLARARVKFPDVPIEKTCLQEMAYRSTWDGVVCIDAMEFLCPEDWPLVLDNLHRALKLQGVLYLTVELADEQQIASAYAAGWQMGLPVVPGESVNEGGGYHYYPSVGQVNAWLEQAGFQIFQEATGDEYRHLLVRKAG